MGNNFDHEAYKEMRPSLGSGARRTGLLTEEKCLAFLRSDSPDIKWIHANGKATYDIYSDKCMIDVVGVDKQWRIIIDHKNISQHRKEASLKRPGYIAFQFPEGVWRFISVSSSILNRTRPVIDGRMLSKCVFNPITRFKSDKTVSNVTIDNDKTMTFNIDVKSNETDNTHVLNKIIGAFCKYPQLLKENVKIVIKHASA